MSDTGTSSGRKIAAIILGVIAVLFIIAGIIYLAEPAKSLPSFMGHKANSSGHHALRMAGSFIVGIVFAAGAWVALAYKPKPQQQPASTPENTPAGHS
jgi:amino acid permease